MGYLFLSTEDSTTYIIIACCTVFGFVFVTMVFVFAYRYSENYFLQSINFVRSFSLKGNVKGMVASLSHVVSEPIIGAARVSFPKFQ